MGLGRCYHINTNFWSDSMPTVSVKLAATTKEQLDRLASLQGISPHALMVQAIESTLDAQEAHQALLARAESSRSRLDAGAPVLDGPAFADYLRAKVRGQPATRPTGKPLADFTAEDQ